MGIEVETDAAPEGAASTDMHGGFARIVDRSLEGVTVGLMLVAVAVACLQVVLRYIFNSGLPWPEELATWVFGWAVFLGMAVATARDSHISIDVVTRALPARPRAYLLLFNRSVMAAASIMLVIHGWDYANRVISASPALQWSMQYYFVVLPVGAAFNLFFLAWPSTSRTWLQGLGVLIGGVLIYAAIRYGASSVYGQSGSAIVLVAAGIVSIVIGVPVAFALIFGAFAAFAAFNPLLLVTISQNMGASMNSFTLLAIPFFILAAAVMNAGGITPRLVDLAMQLVGHLRGGLGQANVVTNTMLAGVSGSSTADASTIAKLLVPEMAERGYSRPFGAALTASAATLANLIPPSLGLIIYAALASVSVGALFVATIVPGLMVAGALMLVVYVLSRLRGYGGDLPKASLRERMSSLGLAIPALILPVIIVGGVRFGVFTATEAGAIAFIYAFLCGALLYRKLTAANFIAAIRESALDTVVIAIIIAAAAPFAWVLAFEQVPQKIALGLAELVSQPIVLILAINLFLIIVGLFMEMIASLVILVPILVPLVIAGGMDPIQFGVVIVMNLVIGALTPPLGVLVFTTARVGGANQTETFKAILPFVAALVTVLMLVTFVPAFTMLPVAWLGP
ncbi:TRAP transporter large permease subunit [Nitratireductor mangrovi]|uniref:TRAP transporter large permease subunit n=1 Tax=Nitratireductor mangrovi TaxID=2599600 RepID=A0A5B8KYZ5_9HYPH|nr:TRAP transporter large permease subunit [Nitratireductor mangrovi]QDZ00628.1 TRAP transporter large permease subunit [Nitratireductor mangrovi]